MGHSETFDLCVIGGGGHVGLPLSIQLANHGKKVCIYDINPDALSLIEKGIMPFKEEGAEPLLKKVIKDKTLEVSQNPEVISLSRIIIMIVGTPVDEFLNPKTGDLFKILSNYIDFFRDGQLLVLRSTVYPGVSRSIYGYLKNGGKDMDVAFCPERIAEGYAIEELVKLPQIVSSFTPDGLKKARDLFSVLTKDVIELSPEEAELTKLFNNSWRYIKFAAANQFFMIANDYGYDYSKIYHAMTYNYPRAKDFPKPGFAAGPCLFKDTMQLSAFNDNNFILGHTAMLINEGLPNYVVKHLESRRDISSLKIGILGMAFKGDSDDKRDSLSYKLKKILEFKCAKVYCSDPYVKDGSFVAPEDLIDMSDVLVLATPHSLYKNLNLKNKPLVDIWNFYNGGYKI